MQPNDNTFFFETRYNHKLMEFNIKNMNFINDTREITYNGLLGCY